MPLISRWVGESDLDRVADTRLRCYAPAANLAEDYRLQIRTDSRAKPGDYLLIEDAAEAVGTATSLSQTMWVRGSPVPCQGVAWVGTIRTRRRSRVAHSAGIASRLMHETLRMAREHGQVLSALMPFRASFYEHFGYGIVERQCAWTVPIDILPAGPCDGLRFSETADRAAIAACYQRFVERGHCCIERNATRWDDINRTNDNGFEIIDRPIPTGPVRGVMHYSQYQQDGKDILRVNSHFADDPAVFLRQLHFMASLKDQYQAVHIRLPADFPLNWLLTERQLPHRLVNHPTAKARPYTKMQVRVLDHIRLLEAMHWPVDVKGSAVIAVHESEGHISKFRLELDDGHAKAQLTYATADIECRDTIWGALVLGDLSANRANSLSLISLLQPDAMHFLNAMSAGPAPYNEEYF